MHYAHDARLQEVQVQVQEIIKAPSLSQLLESRILRLNTFEPYFTNMVLTLYGVSSSTCTQRAAIVLHEKKVAFKFVNLSFQNGDNKSAEHLKRQPFGQVPVLDVRRILFVKCLVLTLYV